MPQTPKPPFRADHVGSLLRPAALHEARAKAQKGEISAAELCEAEDDAILASAPGRVFGREELLDAVWGRDGFVEPRTVDVHVARLRAKFTAAKLPAPGVDTVRGVGYRFREPTRS